MSESSTPRRTPITRVANGSRKWPMLGIRVRDGQREALVAEVNAAVANGQSESLQHLCGEIFDAWLLTRPPLSEYAEELHREHERREKQPRS